MTKAPPRRARAARAARAARGARAPPSPRSASSSTARRPFTPQTDSSARWIPTQRRVRLPPARRGRDAKRPRGSLRRRRRRRRHRRDAGGRFPPASLVRLCDFRGDFCRERGAWGAARGAAAACEVRACEAPRERSREDVEDDGAAWAFLCVFAPFARRLLRGGFCAGFRATTFVFVCRCGWRSRSRRRLAEATPPPGRSAAVEGPTHAR